jgi:hypothetical protein
MAASNIAINIKKDKVLSIKRKRRADMLALPDWSTIKETGPNWTGFAIGSLDHSPEIENFPGWRPNKAIQFSAFYVYLLNHNK